MHTTLEHSLLHNTINKQTRGATDATQQCRFDFRTTSADSSQQTVCLHWSAMAAVRHLSVTSIRMHDLLLWLQLQPVSQHLCYGKALVLLRSKHTVLSVDF
jgi:hypothetical protein